MTGSRMTRSPDLVWPMKSFVRLSCSATRGEMFALKPPVPRPMTMMATMKHASEPWLFSMTPGTAETMRRT